ncbi:hypothetical protein BLNAU_16267 [Blattamonas nauphoetae]|uniref:Uncharacterized protein n=1 Tax=Blattamonas nauphoetae TaxID=2049346 RepID=A0ABQ9X8H1_9EUKA|nr:hypothetical protein BLNAU_16267 [Blattamonas nauphoetae]
MWVSQFETKEEIEVGNVRLPAMTASSAPILARFVDLEVNHNPRMVRCAFCGSLVAENFPNHYCEGMSDHNPTIPLNLELLDALDRSNKTGPESVEEHIRIEQHNRLRLSFTSREIVFEETELSNAEIQKNQSPEPKTVTIQIDFVSIESHIRHKKVSSGLWPRIQSVSHQKDCVQVTCTSEIPGTPDFYRLPFPSQASEVEGAESTPNQSRSETALREPSRDVRRCTSTHQSSESPNDPSNIVEAHCLWSGGCKLGYENDGNWKYRPIKLAGQPFQSLEFDVPSVDITDPKHTAQYMLPAVANPGLDHITVRSEKGTDYFQKKRIKYESFWQSLNRKKPIDGMASRLKKDPDKLITMIQRCGNLTEKCQLEYVLAKGFLLQSRLSLQSGDLETAMSFFGQSKEHMELNDTAEVECELMERMEDCENEVMRSHPACLEAKELLLRSRQSLQSGDLQDAIFLIEQSKQHMEMNDTTEVKSESERVVEDALNCFRMDWRQWIPEKPSLPILLSPSFDILHSHLQQVEEHVATLGSHLERSEVEVPMTDESRQRMAENPILQALKEGLNLQLLIAWRTGSRDEVIFFQNELSDLSRFDGSVDQQMMPTLFKSEEEQIEELEIGVVTKAIENILNTTRTRCGQWRVLLREHQQALSSAPQLPDYLERTRSASEMKMMRWRNASVFSVLPIDPSVPLEIRMKVQLDINGISGIVAACHRTLQSTHNNEMINDLYEMIVDLSRFVTTTSHFDANLGNVEIELSNVMMIDRPEEETNLPEGPGTVINEALFGKRKRGYPTDLGPYDIPPKAEMRKPEEIVTNFHEKVTQIAGGVIEEEISISDVLQELGKAYNVMEKHDQVLLLVALSQFHKLEELNGACWGIKEKQLNYAKKLLHRENPYRTTIHPIPPLRGVIGPETKLYLTPDSLLLIYDCKENWKLGMQKNQTQKEYFQHQQVTPLGVTIYSFCHSSLFANKYVWVSLFIELHGKSICDATFEILAQ